MILILLLIFVALLFFISGFNAFFLSTFSSSFIRVAFFLHFHEIALYFDLNSKLSQLIPCNEYTHIYRAIFFSFVMSLFFLLVIFRLMSAFSIFMTWFFNRKRVGKTDKDIQFKRKKQQKRTYFNLRVPYSLMVQKISKEKRRKKIMLFYLFQSKAIQRIQIPSN